MAPKKRVTESSAAAGAADLKKDTTASTTTASSSSSSGFQIALDVWQRYLNETSQRILLLDSFLLFLVAVGVVQFVYCVLVGNYPFNAFLSGFGAAVGQFVLTVSLRMQISESPRKDSKSVKSRDPDDDTPSVSSER
ncbi:oligosaccharyltransferase complex subunit epsilon [Ascosphaera pollenicola]|nr:oligosaccharyltransferase complex subunit epsilon [Ascosphaera pollenicola]